MKAILGQVHNLFFCWQQVKKKRSNPAVCTSYVQVKERMEVGGLGDIKTRKQVA